MLEMLRKNLSKSRRVVSAVNFVIYFIWSLFILILLSLVIFFYSISNDKTIVLSPIMPMRALVQSSRPTLIREVSWPKLPFECVEYTVGYNDTIWSIAVRYYPDRSPLEVEDTIRYINNLQDADGPILRIGQKIWIPDPDLYGVGCINQLAKGGN